MLVALFVFTGLISKHRMSKNNIAWWFLAIVCLIVRGLIIAVKPGFVSLDASLAGIFAGWDIDKLKILGAYLGLVNVATFIVFVWNPSIGFPSQRAVCPGREFL